ncbi:M1 family metallopeptidase [Actinocorallia sp. API 0066]|uniref:M1 family metallopeptidase n=1 Tax=Actinocorallia sp. API 0066 TaxID=2896846 RepID=UPI001E545B85|nr:M1 family metallopeptidase [Actinocorallia sp. API 0066]MCD0447869.1 M1 family metallopeptidase [Actinocorallia sp. API 0066]
MRTAGMAATAMAASVTLTAGALALADVAGAPGVGDPYFPASGNGGYNALHYDVVLKYTPKTQTVAATVTMTARAGHPLRTFNLDFRGPRVTSVTVDGIRAAHTRDAGELVITPAVPLARGEEFTTVVSYTGTPTSIQHGTLGTYGWIKTREGAIVLAEPDGASTWLPVNDHPSDKATYDFTITVPKHLKALANGEPLAPSLEGNWATFRWRQPVAMASYLASVAIGKWEMTHGKVGDITVITAVDPKFKKSLTQVHRRTMRALRWGRTTFGPYPFRTSGAIVDDPRLDYALETQDRPIYGGFVPSEDFVVHELAHQWFGNSVTVRRWKDIWLNEGFATYAEWMYREHRSKKDSAAKTFRSYYRQPAKAPIFQTPPGAPGREQMFGFPVYVRGAMTLHVLRQRVGDAKFRTILKTWAAERQGGHGTTEQFVALSERVSGKKLDKLFQVWLYKKGKPKRGSW